MNLEYSLSLSMLLPIGHVVIYDFSNDALQQVATFAGDTASAPTPFSSLGSPIFIALKVNTLAVFQFSLNFTAAADPAAQTVSEQVYVAFNQGGATAFPGPLDTFSVNEAAVESSLFAVNCLDAADGTDAASMTVAPPPLTSSTFAVAYIPENLADMAALTIDGYDLGTALQFQDLAALNASAPLVSTNRPLNFTFVEPATTGPKTRCTAAVIEMRGAPALFSCPALDPTNSGSGLIDVFQSSVETLTPLLDVTNPTADPIHCTWRVGVSAQRNLRVTIVQNDVSADSNGGSTDVFLVDVLNGAPRIQTLDNSTTAAGTKDSSTGLTEVFLHMRVQGQGTHVHVAIAQSSDVDTSQQLYVKRIFANIYTVTDALLLGFSRGFSLFYPLCTIGTFLVLLARSWILTYQNNKKIKLVRRSNDHHSIKHRLPSPTPQGVPPADRCSLPPTLQHERGV